MKKDDLEDELRNLKLTHLTEIELVAYCEQELDRIRRARVEAHLKQCFRCERQLELLREESEALSNRRITSEDVVFVEQLIAQTELARKPPVPRPVEIAGEVSLKERLAEYLRQMVASWQNRFPQEVRKVEDDQGKEIWQWQSDDGRLKARATIEKNADLIIHFSSTEIDLEGVRLNVRLRQFNQEITLRHISESEVYAKVAVPWQYRRKKIKDISIEIV